MSSGVKLAKDYAQALLVGVKEISKQDQILNHAMVFEDFIQNNAIIKRALYSPIIDKSIKIKLVDSIVDQGKFEKTFKQFLHVLIKNARCNLLPQIITSIEKIIAEAKGVKLVEVVSAFKLESKEKKKIEKDLEQKVGCAVEVTFNVDQSIIGGIVVKYDSNLIDCSVVAGLNKIENLAIKLRV